MATSLLRKRMERKRMLDTLFEQRFEEKYDPFMACYPTVCALERWSKKVKMVCK